MTNRFSVRERSHYIKKLTETKHDVLIIGGGITGAGIALDAVTRGLSVGLIDMQDFAGGTSCRSTKLVHGGLRYLKQFEIGIVKEVGRERAIVYENGPHVTTPEWMLLPFYKGGTFGPLTTSIGLKVYDYLAGVKKAERRTMLSPEETVAKEPLIKKEGLRGGGYYVEYKTDDARLTIEVLKSAVKEGAVAVNYLKVEEFLYTNENKINGVLVKDGLTGTTYTVNAERVVNAAGPWVDDLIEKDYAKINKKLRLTKGIHLVFDQSVFPLKQAVYFDTPDGRMIFAIPREGKTYVGTTDTFYDQDKSSPKMTAQDRDYLIHAIQYIFPNVQVSKDHLESSWAGIRPLIYEEGKNPSEISRKDEIWHLESGLITIAGGKLTGYRKMAENVVDLIFKQLHQAKGIPFKTCQTVHYPISGGDVGGVDHYPQFIEEKTKLAQQFGLSREEGLFLCKKYGSNIDLLLQYMANAKKQGHLPPSLYIQLQYALDYEMVTKPTDFFIRRTGALFFNIDWVKKWKEQVITVMGKELDWTADVRESYERELENEIHDATTPIDEQLN